MNDDLPRVYYPLSVLDELREQRALDNDDLARAYDMGRDKERAAVVAWLREKVSKEKGKIGYLVLAWAYDINRGEHRKEEP
jgi:hypothetical protein